MRLSQVVEEVSRTRYTKIPIYQDRRDNIVGILHIRDLLGMHIKKISEEAQEFYKFLRKPYFVPESKSAVKLFRTFRERRQSIALTVDEYGGVTGLVTMEDLLECIFGEIHSPSDTIRQVHIKDLGNGCFESDGRMPISEFNSKMGTDLSHQWGETIGGVLLHHCGELPPEGATLDLAGFKFTFTDVGENRIRSVQFERIEKKNKAETSD
jgi:magnesium and cobalt transporter